MTTQAQTAQYRPAYDMILSAGTKRLYIGPSTVLELIELFNDVTWFGKFKRVKDGQIIDLMKTQVCVNGVRQ